MSPTLAAFDWLNASLIVAFLFLSVLMILIVLIQRPQGGGLSGAFGSAAGSGQTAFGARTGDALTIATVGIFVVFLVTAAALNHTIRPPKAGKPTTTLTAPASAPGAAPAPGAEPAPVTPADAQPAPAGDGVGVPMPVPADSAEAPAPTPVQPAPTEQPAANPAQQPATPPAPTP